MDPHISKSITYYFNNKSNTEVLTSTDHVEVRLEVGDENEFRVSGHLERSRQEMYMCLMVRENNEFRNVVIIVYMNEMFRTGTGNKILKIIGDRK